MKTELKFILKQFFTLLFFCFITLNLSAQDFLSESEIDWIKNHPVLKVSNEMDYAPFDFIQDGKPAGYSIDYMNLLAGKVGLKLEWVNGYKWDDLLQMAKNREIDIMPCISHSDEREQYLEFLNSYVNNPRALFVKSGNNTVNSLLDLNDGSLAIVEGYYTHSYLNENFPEINLVLVKSPLEGLTKVIYGEAEAYIDRLSVVNYLIKENHLTGIEFGSLTGVMGLDEGRLRIGVRNDWQELATILNKGIDQITPEEIAGIEKNWISTDTRTSEPDDSSVIGKSDEVPLVTKIIQLFVFIIVFLILLYIIQRFMGKRFLNKDGFDIKRIRVISTLVLIFIIIVAVGLTTIVLDTVKNRAREDIKENLLVVLNSTNESLKLWNQNNFLQLRVHAQNKELIGIVEKLLIQPEDKIKNSNSLREIRNYMISETSSGLWKDFFIINPDNKNIAAFDNDDIGAENLIYIHRPKILAKVFRGEAQLISPLVNDKNSKSVLFYAVPIRNEFGKVLAVLAYRENSEMNFSRICQLGRIGQTGETYAFDREGILLSDSRFDEQLIELGLLDAIQSSSLNIRIKDPGGDLTKGYNPDVTIDEMPLTFMVRQSIDNKPGVNVRGYRDYRGIEVYGAWMWNDELNYGIATEIDLVDALSSYYLTRNILFLILAAVLLLITGSTVLSIIVGEKANLSLKKSNEELESRVESRTSELSQAKQSLENTIEALTHPFYVIDVKSYEIVLANSAARKVSRGEGISTCYKLTHRRNNPCNSVEHPCPLELIKISKQPVSVEHIHFDENDNPRFMEVHGYPIFNKDGEVIQMIEYSLDITERKEAETQILEAKNKTDAILEASTNGIITINEKGVVESFNPAAEHIFGYVNQEIIGQNVKILMPDEHSKNHDSYLSNYLRTGIKKVIGKRIEVVGIRKSGETFALEIGINEVKLENRRLFTAICNDITERKRAETELQENQAFLDGIINNSQNLIYAKDLEGRYLLVNDNWATTLGLSDDQVLGKNDFDIFGEAGKAYRENDLAIMKNREVIQSEEKNLINGEERAFLSIKFPIYDAEGTLSSIGGISTDMTELINAKDTAEEISRDYTNFLESTSDYVYLKDKDLCYLAVSRPLATMLGLKERDDAVGKTEEEVQNHNSIIRFQEEPESKVLKGDELEFIEDILNTDDYKGWVSTVKKPLRDGVGNIVGVLSISRDITKQKEVEQELLIAKEIAEAATQTKSDFLANMSHEIRTPMNAIIGLSHLIQKTRMTKKQEDYIHKIYGSAHNLLGIINDILDFSKIEAGKLSMESIEFNIHEVFENLGNMITEKAHDKGLELVFHVGTEIPSRLMGDPLRLGQILLNLTNNAIKFTDNGEIAVRAEIENREDDKILVKFKVRDTGIGLTEEQQGTLFQAFSQADMSTTRKYGGTGLGLSISKRLAEMMHGEIGVESVHGEGTTFFFSAEFPVRGDAEREIIPDEISDLNVLVVDDNYTSQEVLVEYLKDFSFKTSAVDNGEEAIQLIRKMRDDQAGKFDLVLLDYSMPGMNGFQTAAKINEVLNPEDIPKYILVTGYGRDEIIQGVEKAEFEGFILKPVNQSLLFNTIMQAFGHDRQENKKVSKDSFPVSFDQVRGAKILLAEDNLINQQVATEVLAGEGFFVHIANNGQEAVDLVQSEEFDIILMDLQMPVLDGYKATEKIRSLGNHDQLPIVAMTADAMTGVRDKVIEVGMNDYITKPIETDKLWQSLVQWVKPGTRDLPEGFVPVDSGQPAVDLPEIEGIDVASGLKRVGNNGVLYRNLLKQLIDEYSSVSSILTQLIVEEKREDAIRLAHTIKGVSANLGADKLRDVSADIESKLKNSGFKEEDLERIGFTMDDVVSAINASGILDEVKTVADDAPKKEIDGDKLKTKLKEANDSLSKRKPKPALAIFDELEGFVIDPEIKDSIDECRRLLGKYKMKDAVAILENMELE